MRYRKTLVQQRTQQINRVQKVLETANIKLSSVASDVLGKSGRDMLEALLAGISDVESLADLARGRLRAKLPALREALEGRVEDTHRILLRHLLDQIDTLEEVIDHYSKGVKQHPNADGRVRRRLNFTDSEKAALVAFLKTLSDQKFIADPKFSDPFQ